MDENTPAPRPRRSTLPPGSGRLEARVSVLERTEVHQAQEIAEIKRGHATLDGKVDQIDTKLLTLTGLVQQLLEKRKFWQRVQTGVLVLVAGGIITVLMRISYIVQSGRLPGP